MSIGRIARGGMFLFAGYVVASILGFLYWFVISFFGGAEVVGITSAVDSLNSLVSGIAIIGLPTGVRRFLGREFGRGNSERLRAYFWSSLTLTAVLCATSATFVWVITFASIPLIGFSETMLFATGLLSFLGFSGIFEALFVSIAKAELIAVSIVVSAIVKIISGVFLVSSGLGWLGAFTGIAVGNLSLILLSLFLALRELRRSGGIEIQMSFKLLREPLRAGFVSWLPGIVALFGQQLGTLAVYGSQGSVEAGTYFIAYAVFSVFYLLPASFLSILFPILSGLTDGDAWVTGRVLKLALSLACPSTAFLVLYSSFPLSLMGGDYVQAAPTLSLLALSTIPLTFVSVVSSLVYARGSYGRVLGIGLVINVPRTILYFLLVPMHSGFGAASSFLIGAIAGLGTAIFVARRASFRIPRNKVSIAIFIPFAAGLPCFLLGLNWLVGGAIILFTSILCYARLGVVERDDLAEIARGFASEKTVARIGERLSWLLGIIYGK